MRSLLIDESEDLLQNVVHDLRQPLSNIEICTFHLTLLLSELDGKAQEQIRAIEQQVGYASRILSEAANALGAMRHQRNGAENRPLTNSASASVT